MGFGVIKVGNKKEGPHIDDIDNAESQDSTDSADNDQYVTAGHTFLTYPPDITIGIGQGQFRNYCNVSYFDCFHHQFLILTQGDWRKHHRDNKDSLYVIEPVIESLLQLLVQSILLYVVLGPGDENNSSKGEDFTGIF